MASPLKPSNQPTIGQGPINDRTLLVARLGGSFPVVTAKSFFTLLPTVPDAFIRSFCDAHPGFVQKAFRKEPKLSGKHESKTFKHLKTLYDMVAKSYRNELKASSIPWEMIIVPNSAPAGDRTYYTKPDATQILSEPDPHLPRQYDLRQNPFREVPHDLIFMQCATWWEFKKNHDETSAKDNYHKVIWNMCESLASDPRRFKIYGITIENTSLRMWYHDHSGLLVSMPVDIFKDEQSVVRLFASLSQATLDDMGFDTSMRRRLNSSQKLTLFIDVNNVEYEILETCSDVRAAKNTVGSATRVWKAQDPQGNICTIKDSWVDETRISEWTHYKTVAALDMSEEERQHFITLRDWNHDTRSTSRLRGTIDVDHAPRSPLLTSNDEERGITKFVSLTVTQTPNRPPNRKTTFRRNDRLCFQGCGQGIYCARTLELFCIAWRGACTALHVLHRNDFAHRDISSGNILFYEIDNKIIGRICDFEFLKKVEYGESNPDVHSARSWTPLFASHEVLSESYQHAPELSEGTFDEMDFLNASTDDLPDPPFIQNTIHDAESMFWVLSWGLSNAYPMDERFICPDEDRRTRLIKTFASVGNTAWKARHSWIKKGATVAVHPGLGLRHDLSGHFCRLIRSSFQQAEAHLPSLTRSEQGISLCKTFAAGVSFMLPELPSTNLIAWHHPGCKHDREECMLCKDKDYARALEVSFSR